MKTIRSSGFITFATLALVLILSATRVRVQAAPQGPKHTEAPTGNAENGKRLYTKYGCYECHGRAGQGSTATGPRLGPDPAPLQVLIMYVRNPTGEMPPYTKKVVSDQELADIHAFLVSLPHPPDVKTIPLLKE